MAEIVQLLASPVHRYAGRPGPLGDVADETTDRLEIRAGLGVVGDRYFNRPAHRDASVTVLAAESLAAWPGAGLPETRRNVLLRGVDVDAAAGRVLSLDSGDGPVLLLVRRPARPCAWLDLTVEPGAWKGLRGRAGMRCEPLTDGLLRVGPVAVEWLDALTVRPAGS
ncbi:molybdenum cofactor biosysynthesis protein [uncultured Jatrophihabitans sp.]|uniref:molybdenum cofactor biosysynthesis protein n=1 Tax=uncultured Jatrophihabitans sp. TaxID=1610747 RepID=UPI0035CB85BF